MIKCYENNELNSLAEKTYCSLLYVRREPMKNSCNSILNSCLGYNNALFVLYIMCILETLLLFYYCRLTSYLFLFITILINYLLGS